jgi:hypothetical protein
MIEPGVGPLKFPIGHSRVRGTGYAVSLGSPLLSAEFLDEAADGLVASMRRWSKGRGPGVIVLDWLDDEENGAGAALKRACTTRGLPWSVRRTWERPIVRRSTGGLSIESTLGKETRRQLHKRRRRLEDHLGGEARIVDRSDDVAIEAFLRLEASGWKGREESAYASDPLKAQWFRSMCGGFAALGQLHLLCLQVDDRIVAIQCCVRRGSDAFFFRVAHDDEFSAYGPGVLVQVLGVEHLDTIGVEMVDSCADSGNSFLATLYPDRRQLNTVVIATGSILYQGAVRALPLVAKGRTVVSRFSGHDDDSTSASR